MGGLRGRGGSVAHWMAALAAAGVFGCGGIETEHEATFEVQPGAEYVRMAPLEGCCDLLVGSPARGQLDVMRREGESWTEVGSFLAGREPMRDVLVASVGGRPALLVQVDDEEVTQLTTDLLQPHRLRPPVVVSDGGGIRAIASGDLDHDGIDELVVARDGELRLVDRLELALFADPGNDDRTRDDEFGEGFQASAVAVADVDNDGALDVVALDRNRNRAHVFGSPGLDRERHSDFELDLPARGRSVVATGCEKWPALAVLEDGNVVQLGRGQTGDAVIHSAVERVSASGDALLFVYEGGAEMSLHDECGRYGESIGISSSGVVDAMISRRGNGRRHLALVREDGRTVELHRVDAPF